VRPPSIIIAPPVQPPNNTKSISNHKPKQYRFHINCQVMENNCTVQDLAKKVKIVDQVIFTGQVSNANYIYRVQIFYLSMPTTDYQPHYLK
jgi:hypothetical protein